MNPRRDWLAGCTVGAWTGFALVYAPVVGAVLFVAFAVPAAIGRSLAAIGGLLVGSGAVMLLMIALANWNCAGLFAGNDSGCTPPDLTGWLVAGAAMALLGGVLTVLAIVGSRRRASAGRP
ncbi:MAG TPA: hypothetical protein VHM48_12670 [Candidatus Limnocylindrales bacterium]|nr:hypothetical protein [Candidatus Limnocylindrales bacterium]